MPRIRLVSPYHLFPLTALLVLASCSTTRPTGEVLPLNPEPQKDLTAETPAEPSGPWRHEGLAQSNPLEFLRLCRQEYLVRIRDYRCKFHMRERKSGEISEAQVIAIKFREQPYSVDMTWLENAAGAKRISYVHDRWVKEGRQLALVVPSGVGGVLLSGGIKLDIHGREFKRSSSRSVDQFGFRKTLERAIQLCEQAKNDPSYSLMYAGHGEFEGRPQYILERRLPYSEGEATFPDRLAVFYLDAEWLTPMGVWSFADEGKQHQLGEFLTTDVEYNVGLSDADFE